MLTPCVVSSTPAPSIPCTSQLRGSAPTSRKLVKTLGICSKWRQPQMQVAVDPLGPAERDRREVDVDDLWARLERGRRQAGPPTRSGGLRRSEERIELASRVRLVETHPPGELTLLGRPTSARTRPRSSPTCRCSSSSISHSRARISADTEAATRRQRRSTRAVQADRYACRIEQPAGIVGHLRSGVIRRGQRCRNRQPMVHVELRVVVEGRHLGCCFARQIEVVISGVGPPRLEGLAMQVGTVPVVVEPQTEARSGQSKRPDLGVLSMTPDRSGQPLLTQVIGDL